MKIEKCYGIAETNREWEAIALDQMKDHMSLR